MVERSKQVPNSKVIKEIRDRLQLSQESMAERLDMDRARLSKIERGLETPEWLHKFAALSSLLYESGMSWEDVIMTLPELKASEDKGKYKV